MQKSWYKPFLPHAIAVLVFLIVALVYCSPVFDHKTLSPNDTNGWKAMAQNSFEYKETHGHLPLWTEGLHSGMPAYQISMEAPSLSPQYLIYRVLTLWLPNPAALFFVACICFYFLALALRLNPYVGIVTALAYAYSTYNPSILVVGHTTKMNAIAVMPAFFAALIWLYEKKYLLGTAALGLFTALFIAANHPQVVYYGLIAAAFMSAAYLLSWIKQKDYKHIGKVVILGALGALIGIACNAVVVWTTMDYSKASLRNGSDLATPHGNVTKTGLSEGYALSYSMYKTEAFTLLVPKLYGGSDVDPQIVADDSRSMDALQSMPPQLGRELSGYIRSYWGGIGTTAGPAYAGAVICLFALAGFFLLDDKHKWWILAAGIFTLFISWGNYFVAFNGVLLKVLPGFNKFRAHSLAIIIPTFLLDILAGLTLNKLFTLTAADRAAAWKAYKKGLILVGGIFIVLFILYAGFDYTGEGDKALQGQLSALPTQVQDYVRTFIHALREDRQSMFLNSLLRSLLYAAAAAAVGFFWIKGKLKPLPAVAIIGALVFIDLITIDNQYLNADKYVDAEEAQTPFQPTPADIQIQSDKSYYRVFDVRDGLNNITNQGSTSYFHRSIAGYNPAKLSIYEDLIENQLYRFPNNQPVLDMLNTKYIIEATNTGRDTVTINPDALGAAWLVRGVRFGDSARAVMDALNNLDVKDTAILFATDKNAATALGTPTDGDTISLVKNDNDEMTYQSKTVTPRFAVFSEVFYNRGWHAVIDNNEAPILRTNYVLRGLVIPAGKHTITFTFHPTSYYTGSTIQIIASILLLALLIAAIVKERGLLKKA
jgi:hypothetical protein